jgi:mRNA-degrading endonuclease RelE of RelBE toxin-antitoxin system
MKIKIHKDAEKYLARLPKNQCVRILAAIGDIPEGDIKPLKTREPEMRLRVGDYKVIFEYHGETAYILEIGGRGDVYK